VPALFGFGAGIDIPAGQKEFAIEDSLTLPVEVRAFSIAAHAHYIAKEMKATATLPTARRSRCCGFRTGTFAWQDRYTYKTPLVLPKGHAHRRAARLRQLRRESAQPADARKARAVGRAVVRRDGQRDPRGQAVRKEDEPVLQAALADRLRGAIARAQANGTLRRLLEQRGGRGGGF
jgi:hypothetical protein